ncbi:NAD(P)H-hydrate dehydratase [Polymorphobacter fuscus]|uniref:Bifunctional NAD(P)H-hydrate repair enzyme n=1 Tax=Sandarakinorhabdus fusca TaxID=1439888 RepID=A0A7C9GT87_9SPHN|nr:NAD(P)H-hydrate dehydratase [Polymorphobacter fuscus]KAB7648483.1 NAD(P)H-hydrate dehydratase [Polymorphobacter fuscus]MQT16009.1 NAD(P)H-hydrate dehydratase [Polymorphobacter fuscus]NJC07714.1 hydroxyethylthiazole kinase-like uncharacterized protein yjeF [Polymorphobacter fuscus]
MLTIPPGRLLLTAAQMRGAETAAIGAGTTAETLMARAATAAARAIQAFAPGRPTLVLCGPGNNGGDGFGVALRLAAAGVAVRVAGWTPSTGPASAFAARWSRPVERLSNTAPAPLIVDALFGTGLARPLADDVQAALDRLRGAGATVVALDLPSGIDADTGAALGDPLAADMTVAFGFAKRGHGLGAGRRASGRVVIADIGLAAPAGCTRQVAPPKLKEMDDDVHKYARGGVLVIAGEQAGAARLTALAALRAGAGAVTLVGGRGVPADAIMACDDDAAFALLGSPKVRAVALGPGMAEGERGRDWLRRLLAATTPLVIDAGGLALLAGLGDRSVTAPLVVTPHAGEFARLFGAPGIDRVAAVAAAARQLRAVVVAKGRETIIAAPDGRVAINTHATPWLATAGSGDVLTGIVTALLAQGLAPFDAAQGAVWLHGDAGLRGGAGLIADDIPALLPAVLSALGAAS